jgi:hypothetical protein
VGVPDDRGEHLAHLAERGQRAGRRVQAAEFAFAPQPVGDQFAVVAGALVAEAVVAGARVVRAVVAGAPVVGAVGA